MCFLKLLDHLPPANAVAVTSMSSRWFISVAQSSIESFLQFRSETVPAAGRLAILCCSSSAGVDICPELYPSRATNSLKNESFKGKIQPAGQ